MTFVCGLFTHKDILSGVNQTHRARTGCTQSVDKTADLYGQPAATFARITHIHSVSLETERLIRTLKS